MVFLLRGPAGVAQGTRDTRYAAAGRVACCALGSRPLAGRFPPAHPDLQLPALLPDVEHHGGALLPSAHCVGQQRGSISIVGAAL